MSKETQPLPIQELEQRKIKLTKIINQRESLVSRIGIGEVRAGSSFENTLKVGHTRKMVKDSLLRHRTSLEEVNKTVSGLNQAREHLNIVSLREQQLIAMSEMFAEGNLSKDELEAHQREFEALKSLPEQNPALKKALERLSQEKTVLTMPPPTETNPIIEKGVELPEAPKTQKEREEKAEEKEVKENKPLYKLQIIERGNETVVRAPNANDLPAKQTGIIFTPEEPEFKILQMLVQRQTKPINTKEITKKYPEIKKPSRVINKLRKLFTSLGVDSNKLIEQSGKTVGLSYALNADVEWVKEKSTQEPKPLPKLTINKITGKITKHEGKEVNEYETEDNFPALKVLLTLAMRPRGGLFNLSVLRNVAIHAAARADVPRSGNPGVDEIEYLRKMFGQTDKGHQYISSVTRGKGKSPDFILNANVEIVDGPKQKEKEVAPEKKPLRIYLDEEKKLLTLGEKTIQLSPAQLLVTSAIYKSWQPIATQEIQHLLSSKNYVSNPGSIIGYLENKFGKKIFKREGTKQKTFYSFDGLTDWRVERENKVRQNQIKALELILDNPNVTAEEIMTIVGPSSKTGKSLLPTHVRHALNGFIIRTIYNRVKSGKATEEEKRLGEKLNLYKETSGKSIHERLGELFSAQKLSQQKKDLENVERIIPVETKTVSEKVVFVADQKTESPISAVQAPATISTIPEIFYSEDDRKAFDKRVRLLEKVESHIERVLQMPQLINGAYITQLHEILRDITLAFAKKYVDNGTIIADGKNGKDFLPLEEIVLLLLLREDRNRAKKEIHKLRKFITDEIKTRTANPHRS